MVFDWCASCAPVTTEISGLAQTSMDTHGLAGKVLETAKRLKAAGLGSRPAWLSGGGGIRTLDPPQTDSGFRDRRIRMAAIGTREHIAGALWSSLDFDGLVF
jgi:hypothetical protein